MKLREAYDILSPGTKLEFGNLLHIQAKQLIDAVSALRKERAASGCKHDHKERNPGCPFQRGCREYYIRITTTREDIDGNELEWGQETEHVCCADCPRFGECPIPDSCVNRMLKQIRGEVA